MARLKYHYIGLDSEKYLTSLFCCIYSNVYSLCEKLFWYNVTNVHISACVNSHVGKVSATFGC